MTVCLQARPKPGVIKFTYATAYHLILSMFKFGPQQIKERDQSCYHLAAEELFLTSKGLLIFTTGLLKKKL